MSDKSERRILGQLSVAGTPLGNLSDASPRLRDTLAQADLIACEDTRRTGQLLVLLGIKAPRLVSYHKDNEAARCAELVAAVKDGKQVVLVSDGGMPGISDPGARLVAAARVAKLPVTVIPGPAAVTAAVTGSGFEGAFTFIGFLPRKAGERKAMLARLGQGPEHMVLYEAPGRLAATVGEMLTLWGNREAWVARELTKMHEEWIGPDLETIAETLAARGEVKGECTLVVKGFLGQQKAGLSDDAIVVRHAEGVKTKALAAWVAEMEGVSSSAAYERVLAVLQK